MACRHQFLVIILQRCIAILGAAGFVQKQRERGVKFLLVLGPRFLCCLHFSPWVLKARRAALHVISQVRTQETLKREQTLQQTLEPKWLRPPTPAPIFTTTPWNIDIQYPTHLFEVLLLDHIHKNDSRRFEVMASGLPLRGRAQLAVDTPTPLSTSFIADRFFLGCRQEGL